MFIVLMLPLDKSFHKVKCYSLTVAQASGTTVSNVVPRKKIPRVQIRVVIKIYSFIHSIHFRKQTNKQNKQARADGPTDRPPTIDDDRPTIDDRPTDRPTADDRRRPTDRRRSTTHDHLLRRLLFVFLHFDGRLSMSDGRLSGRK